MSDFNDFNELLPEINSIAEKEVKTFDMPVSIFITEVEALYVRANRDIYKLIDAGFDENLLPKMLKANGALRVAQAEMSTLLSEKSEALDRWKKEMPQMLSLRNELLDNLSFAYRKDNTLLEKIDQIKEGSSNADALQDLIELGILGKNNPEKLEKINFNIEMCDQAISEADRLSAILAEVNGNDYTANKTKLTRDRAYTFLKPIVDEVREYGQFVFRNNKDHKKAYQSKYHRDKNRKYYASKKTDS